MAVVQSQLRCALLGHDFTFGIAGLTLRTETCRRCGYCDPAS
jgi:hypothetical protein